MRSLLIAATLLAAPMAAHAVTVTPGETYGDAFTLNPGDVAEFEFEVSEPTRISPIAISGTGGGTSDLEKIIFGVNDFEARFTDFTFLGNVAAAYGVLDGFVATESFTLLLTDILGEGIEDPVQLTFSFGTGVPAPIPLPAAGLLLAAGLSMLGARAAIKRRTGPTA